MTTHDECIKRERNLAAAAPELLAAAKAALHYMRLHKYADREWADGLAAAIYAAEET